MSEINITKQNFMKELDLIAGSDEPIRSRIFPIFRQNFSKRISELKISADRQIYFIHQLAYCRDVDSLKLLIQEI